MYAFKLDSLSELSESQYELDLTLKSGFLRLISMLLYGRKCLR